MGSTDLVYQEKLKKTLQEASIHLLRIDDAFEALMEHYDFPINQDCFNSLLNSRVDLAFADQIIYRFSKALDTIGAKLFKVFFFIKAKISINHFGIF